MKNILEIRQIEPPLWAAMTQWIKSPRPQPASVTDPCGAGLVPWCVSFAAEARLP